MTITEHLVYQYCSIFCQKRMVHQFFPYDIILVSYGWKREIPCPESRAAGGRSGKMSRPKPNMWNTNMTAFFVAVNMVHEFLSCDIILVSYDWKREIPFPETRYVTICVAGGRRGDLVDHHRTFGVPISQHFTCPKGWCMNFFHTTSSWWAMGENVKSRERRYAQRVARAEKWVDQNQTCFTPIGQHFSLW